MIEGETIFLRPLEAADARPAYVDWLNDPEVSRFRAPRPKSTLADVQAYIDGIAGRGDVVMAICMKKDRRHVGNVTLNSVIPAFGTAELSILIGDRGVWGHGVGRQAIAAMACHGFKTMGLRRLWAESPNPAFNTCMHHLGWVHEGTKRAAFIIDNEPVDLQCWGLLSKEFAKGIGSA